MSFKFHKSLYRREFYTVILSNSKEIQVAYIVFTMNFYLVCLVFEVHVNLLHFNFSISKDFKPAMKSYLLRPSL